MTIQVANMKNIMAKQVLFSGFNDKFFKLVLKNLSNNIEPFQLEHNPPSLGNIKDKKSVYGKFLERHEDIQLHYSDFLNNGIDTNTLKELSECRLFFNRTLDRVFLTPNTSRQIDQYFYALVEFWISYFNKSPGIKTIFFQASPHFPWDTCMFFIAKHLNIKTYILRRTLINDCIMFDEDFRWHKQRIVKYEKSFTGGFEISDLLASYKQNSYWQDKVEDSKGPISEAKKSNLYLLPYRIFRRIKIIFSMKQSYFRLSKYYYLLFVIRRFFQQRKLFKIWEENAKDIPSGAPLLYFPLHFQPERSTDPEADFFSQQILAIKLLLKILPKDWQIAIKEHPRQNGPEFPNLRRLNYRSYEDYQEIFKLPRVVPVSTKVSSAELISSCRLIASCTGTALWESVLQGKPSIAFGATWHSDCKSSPTIYDIEENPLILNQLLTKDRSEVLEDVEDFLKKNLRMFVRSSNSEEFLEENNSQQHSLLSTDLLVSNLSNAIDYIIENEA